MNVVGTVRAVALVVVVATCATTSVRGVPQVAPQSPLTNDDVLTLLRGGLPSAVVVAKIQSSDCRFDTSPDTLVKLQAQNVPDAVLLAMVQAGSTSGRTAPPSPSANAPGTATPSGREDDDKTRVFVTESQSWSTFGYSWLQGNGAGLTGTSASQGGARPQTVEIIKTFGERCPDFVVTNQPQRATFVVTLDHEGGKGALRVKNKIVVFNRRGDAIFSDSTQTLGEAVQRACDAIKRDSQRVPKSPEERCPRIAATLAEYPGATLAEKIRAAHPDSFHNMDDAYLERLFRVEFPCLVQQ